MQGRAGIPNIHFPSLFRHRPDTRNGRFEAAPSPRLYLPDRRLDSLLAERVARPNHAALRHARSLPGYVQACHEGSFIFCLCINAHAALAVENSWLDPR
jgi:hypothetical protein